MTTSNNNKDYDLDNPVAVIIQLRKQLCALVVALSQIPFSKQQREAASIGHDEPVSPFDSVAIAMNPFFGSLPTLFPSIFGDDKSNDKNNKKYYYDYEEVDEVIPDDPAAPLKETLRQGVFPLVIACDKGNIACLEYFWQLLSIKASKSTQTLPRKYWEGLIGSPLYSKTMPDCNTALHHATTEHAIKAERESNKNSKKSITILELLEKIAMAQARLSETGNPGNDNSKPNKAEDDNDIILKLGAATNKNGDTPLMMAVAVEDADHEKYPGTTLPEVWYNTLLQRLEKLDRKRKDERIKTIHDVLRATNRSDNTILSYAWMQGRQQILRWLIHVDQNYNTDPKNHGPAIVSQDTVAGFREMTSNLERKLERRSERNEFARGKYESSLVSCEECTRILEAHATAVSEKVAQELLEGLLLEDENNNNASETKFSKNKKTRKKKKKKKQQSSNNNSNSNSTNKNTQPPLVVEPSNEASIESKDQPRDVAKETSANEEPQKESDDVSVETTDSSKTGSNKDDALFVSRLANGRVAVKVLGKEGDELVASSNEAQPTQQDLEQEELNRGGAFQTKTVNKKRFHRKLSEDAIDGKEKPKKNPPQSKRMMNGDHPEQQQNNLPTEKSNVGKKENYKNQSSNAEDSNNERLANKVINGNKPVEQQDEELPLPSNAWQRKPTISLDDYIHENVLLPTLNNMSSPLAQLRESSSLLSPLPQTQQNLTSPSADAILKALCLDMDSLLHNSHDMAQNLSPAQLDAVEGILRQQLDAVAHARILQKQRSGNSSNGPGVIGDGKFR